MAEQELQAKEKREVEDANRTRPGRTFVPDVDIREDDDALWFWVDMPGVEQDKVTVDLDDDVLTLQGEVGLEDYEGLSPVYTEYNVGGFARRFTLPDGARFDRDAITARMADGVLEIKLPKAEPAKPRRITVTS
ncbi:MAG: Hsp20/alpha crystallin family protein [Thermodesulfobacteriota bacterium]